MRLTGYIAALTVGVACYAQEAATFQAGVSLVHVDAEVTDGTRTLTGFQKDDFQVLDEGKAQKILYFSQEQEALDLVLLFDFSASMMPKLRRVAAAAKLALGELRAGDRAAVMIFGTRTVPVQPFTEDLDLVEKSIQTAIANRGAALGHARGTRLVAAIDRAAEFIGKEPRSQRRRAVVMVTDNIGMLSGRKHTAIKKLWEADAVLSGLEVRTTTDKTVMTVRRFTSPTALILQESISDVAERTGGDVLKGPDPAADFQELMHRMRLRYSLYYAMPEGKAGEERKIKVTLSDEAKGRIPQGRVRARWGYYVPKGNP